MNDDNPNALPCDDKLAFDTKKDAEATANVAHYRYGNKLKAYICRYCGLWHLSSNYDE
jgi:hypothetical protein